MVALSIIQFYTDASPGFFSTRMTLVSGPAWVSAYAADPAKASTIVVPVGGGYLCAQDFFPPR